MKLYIIAVLGLICILTAPGLLADNGYKDCRDGFYCPSDHDCCKGKCCVPPGACYDNDVCTSLRHIPAKTASELLEKKKAPGKHSKEENPIEGVQRTPGLLGPPDTKAPRKHSEEEEEIKDCKNGKYCPKGHDCCIDKCCSPPGVCYDNDVCTSLNRHIPMKPYQPEKDKN